MKVYPTNSAFNLVEANIVESLETRSRYSPHPMIRNEEIFFPPHEHVLSLREIAVGEVGSLGMLCQRTKCWEPCPVRHISLLSRTPCLIPSYESMLGANYLAFEERRQGRKIIRET